MRGHRGTRRMSARIACLALALALSVVSISQSRAANLLEKNFWLSGPRYDQVLPPCDYRAALDRIIGDFQIKEARFWNSRLQIVGIENIQQTALLPWAAQNIPRRFCSGTAVMATDCRPGAVVPCRLRPDDRFSAQHAGKMELIP